VFRLARAGNRRYVDDGRYAIDNNVCENAIRPFVVGCAKLAGYGPVNHHSLIPSQMTDSVAAVTTGESNRGQKSAAPSCDAD
jgi:hypothetical protein